MLIRSKLLILFLPLFFCNMSKSIAVDILSFAEEWEQKNAEKEASSGHDKKTGGVKSDGIHKTNRREVTRSGPSVTVSPSKKEVKKKTSELKEVIITKSESNITQAINKEIPVAHQNVNSSLGELLDPHSGPVFQWLRTAVKSFKGEPETASLLNSLRDSREKNNEANALLSEQSRKFEQQHNVMLGIQKKLKELQYPSLPVEVADREDFAAGMAAGFGLYELITTYESYGSKLNKSAFLQGLNDAITGEKRLSSDEYETLLSAANNRYELARQQSLIKRSKKHQDWRLSFFGNSPKTSEGISYRIIYPGDKKIEPDEAIIISLSRYSPEGELLEDTDIDGRKIEVTLNNYSSLLKNILTTLGLHGEASAAMPVNAEGLPDLHGTYFEKWNVRISESIS